MFVHDDTAVFKCGKVMEIAGLGIKEVMYCLAK